MMKPIMHQCIKVNSGSNRLQSVRKKRVNDFTIFFKSAMYLLKSLPL